VTTTSVGRFPAGIAGPAVFVATVIGVTHSEPLLVTYAVVLSGVNAMLVGVAGAASGHRERDRAGEEGPG
jgi:hypothetical protein